MSDEKVQALVAEVAKLDDAEFTAYSGGWKGNIGTALVDAVFSIRARYQAEDPAKGVIGRLRAFNEKHPEAMNDLSALASLGEQELIDIMGRGVTGKQTKAACVVEAAEALRALEPAIVTAADLLAADPYAVKKAYTGVDGLGWVTCEYFQMLLGKPGVKADRMIVRFVNAALARAGFDEVGPSEAHGLVAQAFEINDRGAASLTHYEHAIWRAKGELAVEDDEPDPDA
ncbi:MULTISPECIES: hypothetical protein [Brachybacterium]|uniref:Uncharacterized protein n=1 Tax=Brachybacterium conglomeratum TaxID=47846 RepID=A0ABQ5RDU2_9MICO|nr:MULTISPECIES: hypothetical protein [Brachybacterium]GLI29531.1 hypothetical protein BCONGLO52_03720 [Brachybacterium conglomeratum]GLK06233.1 hypothetical protein GCM10017597_30330 [Brachybacterium conglomeratum]